MMDFDLAEIAYVPTTGVRRVHETPLVAASDRTLQGYGCLVDAPESFPIEIVRWPAQGWRAIDENSGDQGGVAEGVFEFWWKGETLYARNNAVGDSYLFAWSNWPEEAATEDSAKPRQQALVWRANYHPDGGQLFFAHVHLHGGPAPVRRFLPKLIDLVLNGAINPGKVFDLVLPLDLVAEGYRAMDERRAIKALLRT